MTKKTVKKKAAPKKKATKKAATKKTKVDEPSIKNILTAKCSTISGKSTITYNFGVDDSDQLLIRINGCTAGGFHSFEWITLENIAAVLSEIPTDQPITSLHLAPLFKGKPVNTPGYLLAALLHAGVLSLVQGKKRQYVYKGTNKLLAKLEKKLK